MTLNWPRSARDGTPRVDVAMIRRAATGASNFAPVIVEAISRDREISIALARSFPLLSTRHSAAWIPAPRFLRIAGTCVMSL